MGIEQVNVEFFFRLFYDLIYGTHASALDYATLKAIAASLWDWLVVIGYTVALLALLVIAYSTIRLGDIRRREKIHYATLVDEPEAAVGASPRWGHIRELIGSERAAEWREAILEADIMLDDALRDAGYTGETLSDKLKSVDPSRLPSLQDAWEAHKVRNQIAHEGSSFDLSDTVARRTIMRFERVLGDLKAI